LKRFFEALQPNLAQPYYILSQRIRVWVRQPMPLKHCGAEQLSPKSRTKVNGDVEDMVETAASGGLRIFVSGPGTAADLPKNDRSALQGSMFEGERTCI
jgi:hypothetical protein